MGLFDFFKNKPKAQQKPFPYLFTATDSFRLFTEGLRAFQVWQGNTVRINYDTDQNRSQEDWLTEALMCWQKAHDRYPNDMLPAFYLAVGYWADGCRDDSIALFNKLASKDPDGEVGKCARYNIVALEHGDTFAEATKLGLPHPSQQ